jgi:hypothetical protein
VRDKGRQLDMMGVPEANIDGHAFHTYRCIWNNSPAALLSAIVGNAHRTIDPTLLAGSSRNRMITCHMTSTMCWLQPAVA